MKLKFTKDEEYKISVFQVVDGNDEEFSYVDMIRELTKLGKMDPPDISKGFSDAEISSINSMTEYINKAISATDEVLDDSNSEN